MKRTPSPSKLLGLAFLILALCSPVQGQLCGDCDGSGSLSVVDALLAAQAGAGLSALASPAAEACDVYPAGGSGSLTVLDALWISQRVVGLPVTLQCTLPTGAILEDFSTTDHRDPATTADWGTAHPGLLIAGTVSESPEANPLASATSSIPLQGAGQRFQILLTRSALGGAGGSLLSLGFVLGREEEGGRSYTDLEVWACHTTLDTLGVNFEGNYSGHVPKQIKPTRNEVYGAGLGGETLDLRITPGAFVYNGLDNLLIEIRHRGASAETILQVADGLGFTARVHSSDPLATTGFASQVSYRSRLNLAGQFRQYSSGISTFYDTGELDPDFLPASWSEVIPPGTSISVTFQGAQDDGAGAPDPGSLSLWVPDVRLLSGMRHVRFQVDLQATPLQTPEVSALQIPFY